jgi:hypothetical protein
LIIQPRFFNYPSPSVLHNTLFCPFFAIAHVIAVKVQPMKAAISATVCMTNASTISPSLSWDGTSSSSLRLPLLAIEWGSQISKRNCFCDNDLTLFLSSKLVLLVLLLTRCSCVWYLPSCVKTQLTREVFVYWGVGEWAWCPAGINL